MTRHWPPEDREAFDVLMTGVCQDADSTHERVLLYEAALARQPSDLRWVHWLKRDALHRGLAAQMKGWLKRQRVIVALDDRLVTKPRVIGTLRVNAEGIKYDAQVMFGVMTWDQIRAKRVEALRQQQSYSDWVATYDRLLALQEIVPSALTPSEACEQMGTSLEQYLGATG